jgi:hypothetical protein
MHQNAGKIAVRKQVLEDIQDLRVQQGRRGGLPRRGGAGQDKDSRSDNCADSQRRERPCTQCFLEPALRPFRIGDQFVDGLLGEKLAGQKRLLDLKT